jgi:hypothetical protein
MYSFAADFKNKKIIKADAIQFARKKVMTSDGAPATVQGSAAVL